MKKILELSLIYDEHKDYSEISMSLDEFCKYLKKMEKDAIELGYTNIKFTLDSEHDFDVLGDRLETDTEYKSRLLREENNRKSREDNEEFNRELRWKQYLELKKEFHESDEEYIM